MFRINKTRAWFLFIIALILIVFTSSCGQSLLGSFSTPTNPNDLSYLSSMVGSELATFDNSKLPISPIEDLGVAGSGPKTVDIENYRLTVDGLVNKSLSLSYGEIKSHPVITQVVLLVCPNFFADNAQWTGVLVSTLLAEAGVMPQAKQVTFYALDGYQRTLPLEEVQSDGVFLAYMVDGQVLPMEHGYPLRLVVKGVFGDRWVKWVDHIKIS
jgi:DMSO/TMAO reductase YedYZ molybdopterin-dependent catalytic subunit